MSKIENITIVIPPKNEENIVGEVMDGVKNIVMKY